MKLHTDKKLYIEFTDFIAAGWKEDTVKKANLRNGANWQMVKNPTDQRKPMVEYDTLVDAHKEKLQSWLRKINGCKHDESQTCDCSNPYTSVAKIPIRQMVTKDFKAETFFIQYRYTGTNNKEATLPVETITKYTNEASYLNMLVFTKENKQERKKLNLSVDGFYTLVAEILTAEIESGNIGSKFPTSYQRLLAKIDEYKNSGYPSLIDKAFGNTRAAKICDEVSEGILLQMIEHPNQYDDVIIAVMYNEWAKKNDYKTITSAAVGDWRRKKGHEITAGRYGSSEFNEKYIRDVKGLAPTKVGMLWECDDYNINLYFQNPKEEVNKEMQRYVSYIVADSKTGLVLGKSYRNAKSPVVEMVKLAWIDAMYYVRSLVNDGNWYSPFEIKSDRWQQLNLFPYFKSIANFVPPAKGNKHRGYIEQLFGSAHAKRAEKLSAHNELNYNGNNVTAVNWGVNVEALHDNRSNRPLVGSPAETQIERFFHFMRNMPAITRENMNATSKQTQWLADWNTLTEDQKTPISDEQFLLTFGIRHEPKSGKPITITNRGVEPQINGVKYSYDLPEYVNGMQLIGQQVNVIYDPYDFSRILITDGQGIRMVVKSATISPRALADWKIHAN